MAQIKINSKKSALIVVDMQNAFLSEKGSTAKAGLDVTYTKQVVEPVKKVIDTCRKAGLPIIFFRYVLRPDYNDAGLLAEKFPILKKIGAMVAGTWDAEIDSRLKPQPEDYIIDKTRPSGFYNTGLEVVLRGLNVDSLIICGVTTEICVDSTARDAYARDFNVFLVKDAVAALDLQRHKTSLVTAEYGYATVVSIDELARALGTHKK